MKRPKKTPEAIYEARASLADFRPLRDISGQFLLFIIFLEDSEFYHHKRGYEPYIIRDTLRCVLHGDLSHGGSTITQQLVKNLYFTFEKRLKRKLLELPRSAYLEKHLTKNQILELYVNTAYFDNGQYGICNASHFYFGKEPGDLTVNQAFFLAAILPVVGIYNPLYHPVKYHRHLQDRLRRNIFLNRYLSPDQRAEIERHTADCLDEELCHATPETDRYNAPGPMVNERFGPGGWDCLTDKN